MVVLVPVQWHHVVVLILLGWHHARIIAAGAHLLCSENPLLSQIEKLVPDSQVICQSSKPHAFIRVSLANLSTQIPCPAFDILWSTRLPYTMARLADLWIRAKHLLSTDSLSSPRRSPDWLKMKNPACSAVKREADWGC